MIPMTSVALLLSNIALGGASAGVLASMVLILSTQNGYQAKRVLGVFILALSAMLAQRFISHSGLIFQYPHLQGATQYLRFLLGPCIFVYIQLLTRPDFHLKKKLLWHGVPVLLSFFAFVPAYMQEEIVKKAFIANYMQPFSQDTLLAIQAGAGLELSTIFQINLLLSIAFIVHWASYGILSLIELHRHRILVRSHFSSIDRITLRWLYGFVCLVLTISVIALVFFTRYQTHPEFSFSGQEFVPTLLFTCMVYYVGFMGLRQPVIYHQPAEKKPALGHSSDDPPEESTKYNKSGLSDSERQSTWEALQAYMNTDKPYQMPGLTLSMLAEALSVRAAHLSQTINVEAGMNFFDFVNRFRIEEAKQILQQKGSEVPLSTMGYEVGFNSKSTFYTQFKKHTDGMTPFKYLNSLSAD
jgi:AraC-like DNA-binding protein